MTHCPGPFTGEACHEPESWLFSSLTLPEAPSIFKTA